MNYKILIFCILSFVFLSLKAEEDIDTVSHSLGELVVTGKSKPKDIIQAATLSGDDLSRLNSNSIADALRYFSGVQLKDYGGVGGIKTINIRSMGTNHTGVVYDGVELGNPQNGQIDLGQFSLDNIESLSVYKGQKSEILQPAKDFGNAATVYMKSRLPVFLDGKKFNAKLTYRFGSFGLINPSALLEFKISSSLNISLNTEWIKADGKYKFRYRRINPFGEIAYDTTAVRQNGDINALRLEINFNGNVKSSTWQMKFYNYHSQRGIPGAIVNNVWRRGERLWDLNTFVQGNYSGFFGRFSTLNNIKFSAYRTHYLNNDDRQLKIDHIYRQKEFYFSSANQFEVLYWCNLAVGYDFLLNTLRADIYDFHNPVRFSNFFSVATSIDFTRVKAQASLLSTFIRDEQRSIDRFHNRTAITPGIFFSVLPFRMNEFSIRGFFKRSFRMPTFNDLYYADIGNSNLKPERVTQYNLGLLYEKNNPLGLISGFSLSLDGYYNLVKNKIIAYPKGQQFRWTMLNLGKVDIRGLDLNGMISVKPLEDLNLTLRATYTFQRAIDVTSSSDSYYRHQIPYIPRHSGSVIFNGNWKSLNLNYSWIYVGERYNQQENILYNYTQPWYTSDVSLSYDFNWKMISFRVLFEINNLFSQDYEVIINYPMPKRNYRITLSFSV